MWKVFISAVSLQSKRGLQKVIYQPYGFHYKYSKQTSFPIIPVVMNNMDDPDKTQVILIRSGNTKMTDNYDKLVEELLAVGVREESITFLKMEEKSGQQECIHMLLSLIDLIKDDSIIYTDITYQTKPVSAMILYAMNVVENIKDTEVAGIFYGEIPSWSDENVSEGSGILYDITVFKHMSEMAEQLKVLDVDVRRVLGKIGGEGYDTDR